MPRNLSIGDYIGLEYETETLTPNQATTGLNNRVWRTDHDASCESDAKNVGKLTVSSLPKSPAFQFSNTVIGTELILSPPYCLETGTGQLLEELEKLTCMLAESGEPAQNFRSGLHIHVSMPTSLRLLKTYVAMAANLEEVFFALGTQGYTFRGMLKNESAYCRPITQYGPPCVPVSSNSWAQVFDIESLLLAPNTTMFWNRYGNVDPNRDVNRYHPVRYTWFNLYALLAHGTLEFRNFNTTLNPYLIWAEVLFCKAFCEHCLSVGMSKDAKIMLPQNSVFNGRSKSEILRTFEDFASGLNLPSAVVNILGDTIQSAPEVCLPKSYIKSHLNRRDSTYDFSAHPNVRYFNNSEVKDVVVDDIHARRGERGPN